MQWNCYDMQVTNQVFRYAKRAGATYINKPKMRHYVHCYALHCLDEETSNALRRAFKERGENVGAWRQACYDPLVAIAGRLQGWDIDAIFNSHPRLSIWYVPTKLRQLCHAQRSASATSTSVSGGARPDHLPFWSTYVGWWPTCMVGYICAIKVIWCRRFTLETY